MAQTTYKAFKADIRRLLWPSGEARNLVDAHNRFFRQAMLELSKWVDPCLRVHNTTVYNACATMVECAKTVILQVPEGIVRRVYTIANGEWCDRTWYQKVDHAVLDSRSHNLIAKWTAPTIREDLPALQQGLRYASETTDASCGRSRVGIWSIYRDRIYVFPWIQSNEQVVIEWDGYKINWTEDDLIDTDQWGEDAVAYISDFVAALHEKYYGCDKLRQRDFEVSAAGKLSDLMHWCQKKVDADEIDMAPEITSRLPTSAEVTDDAVEEADSTVIALFGDAGVVGQNRDDVVTLVKGWTPDHIVLLGDNSYTDNADGAYDLLVGEPWHDYIYGYTGVYGDGAITNKLWQVIGNHDRTPAAKLQSYLDFFRIFERRLYWDTMLGDLVHLFVVDSGYDSSEVVQQPDGVTATSAQAEWLKAKLSLSTARWKIVCFHHSPYSSANSSGNYHEYPALRWDFKLWGANAVFTAHSHDYEHLKVDALDYFICGTGGRELASLDTFKSPPKDGSVTRYTGNNGAIRLTADCDKLLVEFYNRVSELIDTVEIT